MKKLNLIPRFLRRKSRPENPPEKLDYSRKIKKHEDKDDKENRLPPEIGSGIL